MTQPFLSTLGGARRSECKRTYRRAELANGKNPVAGLALVSIEVAPAFIKPTVVKEVSFYVALKLVQ